jgi:hypothetical protein
MKKLLFVFILVTTISAGTAFADHPNKLGIGIMGTWYHNWGGGWDGGGALSLKVPSVPIFWGISLGFSEHYFKIGLQGDKYFVDRVLLKEAFLHWYLGLGGWLSFYGDDYDHAYFSLGARLPIGLSFQPVDVLEIFLEMAPSLGLQVVPLYFPAGGWPVSLGIRVWL